MPQIRFSERLKATPTKPGVYIMRSKSGEALYVGKAASLRTASAHTLRRPPTCPER